MVKVAGLYRVGLRVPDLDTASRFYERSWAMQPAGGADDKLFFRSCGEDHEDLILTRAEGKGLDHIALAVADEATLHALLKRVNEAGHAILEPVTRGKRTDELLSAAVADLEGNRLELVVPAPVAVPPQAAGRQRHLGHVVLWSTQIEAQEAFYALLGFQVSDRTHVGMSFLRCNRDHHSIALAQSKGGQTGLQHVAYDIGTVDDVMREFARLRDDGVECIWGVGRHGPGNNIFSYYRDPAGNIVENYGDIEKLEDPEVLEARFWGPEHNGDIWGIAGPPPLAFRDAAPQTAETAS